MIRLARDADGPAFAALIEACWREYGDTGDVRAEIPDIDALATALSTAGGALWAAEDGPDLVGMVGTYPAQDAWHLSRLYVAAGQRGTGLATRLLQVAEAHAHAAGVTRMALWSDVLFTRAHAFYEKHGYLRRGGLRTLGNPSNSIEAGFAKPLVGPAVEELDIAAAESAERPLAALLAACVDGGASLGFLPPLPREAATGYWRGITRAVGQGEVRLFAGWCNGTLAGTVQLAPEAAPNGRHRAELRKLMVAPGFRYRSLARILLAAAEAAAAGSGRRLLLLDTRVGDHAEQLYRDAGWMEAGTVPGYALDGDGIAQATRFFYKALGTGPNPAT